MRIVHFISALALASLLWGQTPPMAVPADKAAEPEQEALSLEDRWGVKLESIRLTAAGHMIDFRYRVLDPKKARALFDRPTKPYLLEVASGARLQVPSPPKVGPLRNSNEPEANKVYWMFFANSGKLLKAGAKVTVVIGEFRAENLTLE